MCVYVSVCECVCIYVCVCVCVRVLTCPPRLQLRSASVQGAACAVLIGESECAGGEMIVRTMATGTQTRMLLTDAALQDLCASLSQHLHAKSE